MSAATANGSTPAGLAGVAARVAAVRARTVKAPVTRKRSKRAKVYKETPVFAGIVCSMIRALRRRVGAGDIDNLAQMTRVLAEAERQTGLAVAQLRARDHAPYSWTDVGAALGTTRQAAQARFGKYGAQLPAVLAAEMKAAAVRAAQAERGNTDGTVA